MLILLIAIIYLSFFGLGLPDSMLGAAWPTIFSEMDVPVSGAGIISAIIAFGTILSSLASDRIINIHPQSGWYFIFGHSPKHY
ncbi:MAG: hypothetical protein J6A90_02520 [Clostridia bacterium]|nr:hypothetical protein [Clostridia bacterium]